MFVLQLYDTDELTEMKVAGSVGALFTWAIWKLWPANIDTYVCGNITYLRRDEKEIGIITEIEFIND